MTLRDMVERRRMLGITQQEIALVMGITQAAVSLGESRTPLPGERWQQRYREALDACIDELRAKMDGVTAGGVA